MVMEVRHIIVDGPRATISEEVDQKVDIEIATEAYEIVNNELKKELLRKSPMTAAVAAEKKQSVLSATAVAQHNVSETAAAVAALFSLHRGLQQRPIREM